MIVRLILIVIWKYAFPLEPLKNTLYFTQNILSHVICDWNGRPLIMQFEFVIDHLIKYCPYRQKAWPASHSLSPSKAISAAENQQSSESSDKTSRNWTSSMSPLLSGRMSVRTRTLICLDFTIRSPIAGASPFKSMLLWAGLISGRNIARWLATVCVYPNAHFSQIGISLPASWRIWITSIRLSTPSIWSFMTLLFKWMTSWTCSAWSISSVLLRSVKKGSKNDLEREKVAFL